MRFMFIFRIAFMVAGSAGGGLRIGEVGSKESTETRPTR
jgi:hypothetical protein